MFQKTKEFIKLDSDEEVADILITTAAYIQNCTLMDRDQLQRLMHPKDHTKQQEEWLRWYEFLSHVPNAQMKRLSE